MYSRAKSGLLAGLLGGAAFMMSSSAFAGPVYFDLDTTWQDNSAESQHIDLDLDGLLEVGDSLRGILRIPTINLLPSGANPSPGTTPNPDLVAIFETRVKSRVATGLSTSYCSSGDATAPVFCNAFSLSPNFDYVFEPVAVALGSFTETYGAGAMVAFYLHNTNTGSEFTIGTGCTTTPVTGTCETNLTSNYSPYLTIGMTGLDGDETWKSFNTPEKPGIARTFRTSDPLGSFVAALSVVAGTVAIPGNQTGYTFLPVAISSFLADAIDDDAVVGAAIRGDVSGTGTGFPRNLDGTLVTQTTNFQARDDTTLQFSAVIPEPGSLLLLGTGLLGLAALRRRRTRA